MRVSLRKYLWAQIACLSLLPILAFAQSSDFAQNLEACKNGRGACDRSKLTESESAGVALADHQRNIANCRDRLEPSAHSKLTQSEALVVARADHQRNIQNS